MDDATKAALNGIQAWLIVLTAAQVLVGGVVIFFAAKVWALHAWVTGQAQDHKDLEVRVRQIEDAMHSCDACRTALAAIKRG